MTAIEVDDNSNGDGSFRSSNGDDENGKEDTVQFSGPQVFVESHKVDVDAVEYEFDTHEHRNHISAGKQTVHADEE
jgi:hypothetical protein